MPAHEGDRYAHAAHREDSVRWEEQGSGSRRDHGVPDHARLTVPSCRWLRSPGLRCGHGRRPSPHRVGIRAAEGSLEGNERRGGARCPLRPWRTPPPREGVRGSVLDRRVWRRMRLRQLPGARRENRADDNDHRGRRSVSAGQAVGRVLTAGSGVGADHRQLDLPLA